MNKSPESISDEAFLKQFESQALSPEHFDHVGHVRLAWLYLSTHNLNDAIELTCDGISKYARSLGADKKFNKTITVTIVRIIALRMKHTEQNNWMAFVEANPDLIKDARALLLTFYSEKRIFSEQARTSYLLPDIMNIQ